VRKLDRRPASAASSVSAFSSSSWKRANTHFKATYGAPQTRAEKKLEKTIDYLCAKAQHQELEISLLKERLKTQETQNKRGQTLFNELRSQEDNKAIFFSPKKIQSARDILRQREQAKEDEEHRKRQAKLEREQKKIQKQLDLDRRKHERAMAKAERETKAAAAKLAREEAKLEKQREKDLKAKQQIAKKEPKLAHTKSISFQARVDAVIIEEEEEEPELAPSSTRAHRRVPLRFRN
jgi:predicted ribosome quality control (RQC) complex YloA/Tae2 family protein